MYRLYRIRSDGWYVAKDPPVTWKELLLDVSAAIHIGGVTPKHLYVERV